MVDPLSLTDIDYVLLSGAFPDRYDIDTLLPIRAANPQLRIGMPAGIESQVEDAMGSSAAHLFGINAGTYVEMAPFTFHGINSATPKIYRDESGNSKALSYVINFGPFSIFYGSETIWHTNLIKEARRWPINLAILPIIGEESLMEGSKSFNGFQAATFAKAISTSLVIPSSYQTLDHSDVTSHEFATCCERLEQRYRLLQHGQRLTMGPVTDPSAGKATDTQPYQKQYGLGY